MLSAKYDCLSRCGIYLSMQIPQVPSCSWLQTASSTKCQLEVCCLLLSTPGKFPGFCLLDQVPAYSLLTSPGDLLISGLKMARPPSSQPTLYHYNERINTLTSLYHQLSEEKMALAYAHKILGTDEGSPPVPFSLSNFPFPLFFFAFVCPL